MITLIVNSITDLPKAAKRLLDQYQDKKVFAFYGSMGAGKTTFIKALCKELGVTSTISSPTFALVNEYKATPEGTNITTIFHFDFYRIKDLHEAYDIGYEDYIYSGTYCFIEWPEKIEQLLPENCIKVKIQEQSGVRTISIV